MKALHVRPSFGSALSAVSVFGLALLGLMSFLSFMAVLALAASASLAHAETSHHDSDAPRVARSFASGDDDDFEYVLVDGSGNTVVNSGSGDWRDIDHRSRGDRPALWFGLDGRRYVVRDRALLDRAEDIVAPMRELGRRQGELGRRQGELGRRQGEIGRRQGELGRRQGEIAMRRLDRPDDDELDRESDAIARQMEELGRRESELGRQQEPLGREQERLGELQTRASHRAGQELRRLAEQAVADGRADRAER
jgi:hypothetical protein